ncbi:MAG: ROK family protein [Chloroflexi bacterium]|nr:ROK family protein [Chloroflexota bacterium]
MRIQPQRVAVGVDVGGTKIAFVLAADDGHVLAERTEPTQAADGPDAVIARMAATIQQLSSGHDLAGIGVACPGPIDAEAGIARSAVNLGWRDVPLRDGLRASGGFSTPIWVENDTNAAALGEGVFGAARGLRNFVYAAAGTGLGGGAVVNGQIVDGANGMAMEIGHMVIHPGGRLCSCGQRGCVEMYASGKGLIAGVAEHRSAYPRSLLRADESPTTHAIIAAARAGDPLAQYVIGEAAEALGVTFAWCAALLNPALIVVAGGVAGALGARLLEPAEAVLKARVLPEASADLRVVPSQIQTPALGPAALVWRNLTA